MKEMNAQPLALPPSDYMPLISVIVPVYNNAEYLAECIGSLIAQSFKDIEIILVDDGSTDPAARALLAGFAERDMRISLITKPNTGYGHSVNLGIARARGAYVGVVESDDYVHSDMYRLLAEVAASGLPDIVKCHHATFIDADGERIFTRVRSMNTRADVTTIYKDKQAYMTGPLINPNGIFKRSFLLENDIRFNETPGASFQDIAFFCKTALLASQIRVVDRHMYFVRRDNAASSIFSRGKVLCPVHEYRELRSFLEKKGIRKELYAGFLNYRKYKTYRFTLDRLDEKYRPYFQEIFIREWAQALDAGELDQNLFSGADRAWIRENLENALDCGIVNRQGATREAEARAPANNADAACETGARNLTALIADKAAGNSHNFYTWQKRLRIAALMDNEEWLDLSGAADLLRLDAASWDEGLESFQPCLFLMTSLNTGGESSWEGLLHGQASIPRKIIAWCGKRHIPTVFWNLAGKSHIASTLATASLFDYVATCDLESVFNYKALLGHEQVFFLPPGARQQKYNPASSTGRRDAIVLAGSVLEAAAQGGKAARDYMASLSAILPLHAYNAVDKAGRTDSKLPPPFKKYIKGQLAPEKLAAVGKFYKYTLELAPLSKSGASPMGGILKTAACGALVLGPFSELPWLLLGDLAIMDSSPSALANELRRLEHAPNVAARLRMHGTRKIMGAGLYADRLATLLCELAKVKRPDWSRPVLALAYARTEEALESILRNYRRQEWPSKRLVVFSEAGLKERENLPADVQIVDNIPCRQILFGYNGLIAVLDAEDWYGGSYFTDLALASRYSSCAVYGKGEFYRLERKRIININSGQAYKQAQALPARRSLAPANLLRRLNVKGSDLPGLIWQASCFSIDPFNYCEWGGYAPASRFKEISDLPGLFTGLSTRELAAFSSGASAAHKKKRGISGREFLALKPKASRLPKSVGWSLDSGDRLRFFCSYEQKQFDYIRSQDSLPLARLGAAGKREITLHPVILPGKNAFLNYTFQGENGEDLGGAIIRANENTICPVPQDAASIKLNLRLSGSADEVLSAIYFEPVEPVSIPILAKPLAEHLLIAPTRGYGADRNIPARILGMAQALKRGGQASAIFQPGEMEKCGQDKLEGLHIYRGALEDLRKILANGRIKKITIFSLDVPLWRFLEKHAGGIGLNIQLGPEEADFLAHNKDAPSLPIGLSPESRKEYRNMWRFLLSGAAPNVTINSASHYSPGWLARLLENNPDSLAAQNAAKPGVPARLSASGLSDLAGEIGAALANGRPELLARRLEDIFERHYSDLILPDNENSRAPGTLSSVDWKKEYAHIIHYLESLPNLPGLRSLKKALLRVFRRDPFTRLRAALAEGFLKVSSARHEEERRLREEISSPEKLLESVTRRINEFKFAESALLADIGLRLHPAFQAAVFGYLAARAWLLAGEKTLALISLLYFSMAPHKGKASLSRFRMDNMLRKKIAPIDWQKLIAKLALKKGNLDAESRCRLYFLLGQAPAALAKPHMAPPALISELFDFLIERGNFQGCAWLIERGFQFEPVRLLAHYLHSGQRERAFALVREHDSRKIRIRNPGLLYCAYHHMGNLKKAFYWLGAPGQMHLLARAFPEKAITSLERDLPRVKRALVFSEWFLADEFSYARFYPEIISRMNADHCAVVCDWRLLPLLERTWPQIEFIPTRKARELEFIEDMAQFEKLPSADLSRYMDNSLLPRMEEADRVITVVHALPAVCGTINDSLFRLKVDQNLKAAFRQRLKELLQQKGKKIAVGLSWRSSIVGHERNLNAISQELMTKLFELKDILWVNCQYDSLLPVEKRFFAGYAENFVSLDDIDQYDNVDQCAAFYASLDCMVSAPSYSGQLAALTGIPSLMHAKSELYFPAFAEAGWKNYICDLMIMKNFAGMENDEVARWIEGFIWRQAAQKNE